MSDEVNGGDVSKDATVANYAGERQLDSRESPYLPLGFFVFGFAISWTAGLTAQAGSGTAMLSGFFAFVGGAFVSFSGFQMAQTRGTGPDQAAEPRRAQINTGRFGRCLVAISLGIVLGGPAAYLARSLVLLPSNGERPAPSSVADTGPPSEKSKKNTEGEGYVYQAEFASACDYSEDAIQGKPSTKVVASALASLLDACTEADECPASAPQLLETLKRIRAEMCQSTEH